ncbi:MAG: protoporphyrinogen oxidase [Planctomycetia bacterium]|nr:protoporphyrinogen oxidase [Planctomycetia bacterium]
MSQVVIIGGGISGLSVAFRLQQLAPHADVTVLEERDRVGGNAWTERHDGFQVEIGPNGFLDNKPGTVQLCRDLGLAERLLPASETAGKNRYLFLDGRLRRLPAGFADFLKSDLLSWRAKASLLWERFRRNRPEQPDETIDAFARRRAGPEAAEVFADAFVTGIHGGDPALLSARAAFPRLAALEAEHGSVLKGLAASAKQRRAEAQARGEAYRRAGKMWSFREGLRLLVETLRDRLKRPPLVGVAVKRLERPANGRPGWLVRGEGADQWPADAVILACPAYRQAAILGDLDAELAEQIAGIAYNRIAVVALGFRAADLPRPPDGFGYIAPQRTRRDLLGVQWCSTIFPDRAPQGMVLLRALCGGWHRAEVVDWDDARLSAAVRAELQLAQGISAAPVFQRIVRWDRAIPQYLVGHLDRVAWIEARTACHPGLFLTGNAYRGVALNDCTEQGQIIAEQVRRSLAAVDRRS